MVKLSVVMGVYNGAARLEDTLASIFAQTEDGFELIVVDDGSTDATPALLDAATARDSRVRVMRQENRGLTRALRAGCELAQAPYIARHDVGDRSHPERFARQARALDADPELAFVSCATEYVGPDGEHLYVARGSGAARTPSPVLDPSKEWGMADGPSHHGSVMFRTDAYRRAGGYRPEFHYGQDWDLWYRLAAIGKFQLLEEALYVAQIDAGTISAAARGAQQQLAKLSLEATRLRAAGESDAGVLARAAEVRAGRRQPCSEARALYFIGEMLRRNGDPRARAYFRRAIRSCPLHLKSWVRLAQTLRS